MQVQGHAVHRVTVGDGLPRLILHCMLARHDGLLPLAKELGGQVTLMDLPGHGCSDPWDGRVDYEALTDEAAAASCEAPTHVIGHSYGATAALRLAVARPELVSRLTLIEPVYFAAAKGTPEFDAYRKAFRPFVSAMLQGDEDRAAAIFAALWNPLPWDRTPAKIQQYMTDRIHLVVASGAGIEEDPKGITSPESLGQVDIPVTLIKGAATQPIISYIHAAMLDRLPNASEHVIAGAGHMVAMDRNHMTAVARIIRAADPETG